MKVEADIEVKFEFIGFRKGNVFEGYRPTHLVEKDHLTSGVHYYYNLDDNLKSEIMGTITFISPEEYPACMWIGKTINMYEGSKLIGYATVTKIFNSVLKVEQSVYSAENAEYEQTIRGVFNKNEGISTFFDK